MQRVITVRLSYSIWHIFRIEDIVAHTLIVKDEQIFITGGYQKKVGSPIITTGNELQGQGIAGFSKQLNIRALYEYAKDWMHWIFMSSTSTVSCARSIQFREHQAGT